MGEDGRRGGLAAWHRHRARRHEEGPERHHHHPNHHSPHADCEDGIRERGGGGGMGAGEGALLQRKEGTYLNMRVTILAKQ